MKPLGRARARDVARMRDMKTPAQQTASIPCTGEHFLGSKGARSLDCVSRRCVSEQSSGTHQAVWIPRS